MRPWWVLVPLFVSALTGCLQGHLQGNDGLPSPATTGTHVALRCLAGSTDDPQTHQCRTEFTDTAKLNFVQVVRPVPSRVGVAVGAGIEGATTVFPGLPRLEPTDPGIDLQRPMVLVTEDGGATWTKHVLPSVTVAGTLPPVDLVAESLTADLAIAGSGRLHVPIVVVPNVATATPGSPAPSTHTFLYYTHSDDLGATWSPAVGLGVVDSTWYPRVGLLPGDVPVVAWALNGTLQAKLSPDGGTSWNAVRGDQPECTFPGAIVPLRGSLFLLCWSGVDRSQPSEALLARIDADGTLHDLGLVGADAKGDAPVCQSYLLASQVDRLAFLAGPCARGESLGGWSADGGATWEPWDPWQGDANATDQGLLPIALAGAPDGSAHALFTRDSTTSIVPTGPDPQQRTVYVAYGRNLEPVTHVLLQDGDPCPSQGPRTSTIAVGNAIALWEHGGFLAYSCWRSMLTVGLDFD